MKRRAWLALVPAAAVLLAGCGAISSLLPSQTVQPQQLLNNPQPLPVTRTKGSLTTRQTTDNLTAIATLTPGVAPYTTVVSGLQNITLTQVDAFAQVSTSGSADAYPAQVGIVMTTDTTPMTNEHFWALVAGTSPEPSTGGFALSFNIASAGDLYFGASDPGHTGVTYVGPIVTPAVASTVTQMFNSGQPITIYAEVFTAGTLTGTLQEFGFSGTAQPHV
jgi:hypothetical protein